MKLNLKRPIDSAKERVFNEWYRTAMSRSKVITDYMKLNKKIFNTLLTTAGWLTSDHVDIILFYIRRRRFEHQNIFTQRCVIMDMLFWVSIQGRYSAFTKSSNTFKCDSTLLNYVNGTSLRYSTPWWNCDYLYIPINREGAHWLAVCVDLKARHINLYNSNVGNKYSQNKELDNAKYIKYLLLYLLKDGKYYDNKPEVPASLDPFTMTVIKGAPHQDNGARQG